MSLQYLKEAVEAGDTEKLIRYVRLHFGEGERRNKNAADNLGASQARR
jgi:hypothetical protein